MKKLIAGLAALILGATSLFAWTNIIQLGVTGGVPEILTTYGTKSDTYTLNNIGVDFGYIGTFDSNLSLKANTRLGFGPASCKFLDNFPDKEISPLNFNVTEIFGVGYSFINTDTLFLALYGNIGNSTNCAFTAKQVDSYGYVNLITSSSWLFGGEIAAVYTPSEVFSIYASLSANYAFGELATVGAYYNFKSGESNDNDAEVEYFFSKPFFKLLPSIGIAWKF